MPRLKQIASSTFDLPEPFGPEIAVKHASRSVSTVRLPCDLKPSRMISMSRIPACAIAGARVSVGREADGREQRYQSNEGVSKIECARDLRRGHVENRNDENDAPDCAKP